jgi:hypothetical protein
MANSLILDSLEIHDFRGFRRLRIERLARVNLIVGKNNVGKTTLLEALWLYAERGAPTVLWQILRERHESKRLLSTGAPNPQERLAALRALFYGRQEISLDVTPEPIKIGPISSDDQQMSIAIECHKLQLNHNLLNNRPAIAPVPEWFYMNVPLILIQNPAASPSRMTYRLDHNYKNQFLPSPEPLHHVFVGADGLSAAQLASFWDRIVLTDLEDQVTGALRLIAPELQRISLTSGLNDAGERMMMARMSTFKKPIPLRSLGEGINRLLHIALALVNAKEGILLLDEIENGLHYSILPDVWRFIFKVANKLNVQLFVTSHSWECIEAFGEAVKDNSEELGLLISLREHQKEEGTVAAVLFDQEAMDIITKHQIEVR